MARLLPLLPAPYDLDALNKDMTVRVVQGDTAEFLFIATSLDGDTVVGTDALKIVLADGTQEGTVIWIGGWADTLAETNSETPNVYRAVIPYAITKTLREGAYAVAVAAEFTVDTVVRNETLAAGTLMVEAAATSPVRRHPYTGWTQVADFCQEFEINQAVTLGVTEVELAVPAGCVVKDVTSLSLSGFDPEPNFDIVVSIDAITVKLSAAAAGTAPTLNFYVVKTNVDEASPS